MSGALTSPTRRPKSTDEWQDIARVPNLYYHILSWPEKKLTGWNKQDFYATGVSDWADFRDHWRQYDPQLGGRCVEIGCGVGRLTHAMAEDFENVVALDVAMEMLEGAREIVPPNVDLELVEGSEIPVPDRNVSAVFSVVVLQHLETFEDVRGYMQEAYRSLAPNGSIMLNISLARRSIGRLSRFRAELELRRSRLGLKRGKVHPAVRWREYPWEQIYWTLRELGFQNIQLKMFPVRSNGFPYQFWFATRPR